MSLLDDLKMVLRISTETIAFDDEINDLILAAKEDLKSVGIVIIDETDSLIKRAIVLYVKSNFGWENKDAERLDKSYQMLKNHLSLSKDYAFYKITFNTSNQQLVIFDEIAKETNEEGTAIFHHLAGNHIYYKTENESGYIDVSGDIILEVV